MLTLRVISRQMDAGFHAGKTMDPSTDHHAADDRPFRFMQGRVKEDGLLPCSEIIQGSALGQRTSRLKWATTYGFTSNVRPRETKRIAGTLECRNVLYSFFPLFTR